MPMNRRELLTASVAGAAMLQARERGVRCSSRKHPGRDRCGQDRRADHSAHFRRVHGAGYDASLGRDADRQEVRQPDYQLPRRAGAAHDSPMRRFHGRAISTGWTGRNGGNGHRAAVCRQAQPAGEAGRFRASRHSAVQTAPGPREVLCGPGVSCRRSRRQSCGPAGLGTWRERLADHIDPTAVARVPEIPVDVHFAGRHTGGAPGNRGHRQRRVPRRDGFADACR